MSTRVHFIKDIADKDESGAIVQAVTSLASRLNMATTAEGVETHAQLQIVERLGCTEMQGYLYSRPVPARDLIRLLPTTGEPAGVTAEEAAGSRAAAQMRESAA
jgi:EAL domain-containing protein (putative c-di-GMP-specific phosphodiesterase class I)